MEPKIIEIGVDWATVRKNPEHEEGGYRKFIPGPLSITVDGREATEVEIDLIEKGETRKIDGTLEIRREAIDVSTIGTPSEFLFGYEKYFVACEYCGYVFDVNKVEHHHEDPDNEDYDEDLFWAECPNCARLPDVKFRYEDPHDGDLRGMCEFLSYVKRGDDRTS